MPDRSEDTMQKAVIVNGTTELLDMVQPVLTAGHYDVVFVESNARAYSHIKRERPGLIILRLDERQRDGFQVLSMLKLDDETRAIPLLTCLSDYELAGAGSTAIDREDDEMLAPLPSAAMN